MLHARRMTHGWLRSLARANRGQDELLARLVRDGAASDFGRKHHFSRIRNYQDYIANVPVRDYAGHAPYIDRVRRGDVSALFSPGTRVLMFALTSGTTAEPKYIPITPAVLDECRRGWNIWGLKAISDHPAALLRSILQVTSSMNDHAAPSGAPCGAITGLLAATQKKLVRRYYTSPAEVAGIKDSTAKYYTIMRLAVPRDVSWAVTANPSTLLLLAKTADAHKETLIRDVHDGTLCEEMAVDGAIRISLRERLKADPHRARRLERLAADRGALLPKDYWNLDFLAHWTGGTMGLYREQFPPYFGELPVRDIGLIASEGRMSIPIANGTPAGVLSVTSAFFEFIPSDEYGTPKPTVLRMNELRIGEEYFVVLTNASGLYRYDLGDRVRVVEAAKNELSHVRRYSGGGVPVIEFLSRGAHTSSLTGEKLTEHQVVMAMRRAMETDSRQAPAQAVRASVETFLAPPAGVADFVLAPRWGEVPRYRLYVEESAFRALPNLGARLDAALSEINGEYASKRQTQRLGAPEVQSVPDGSLLQRDTELRTQRARTAEQFKHQYLLPTPGMDKDLELRY